MESRVAVSGSRSSSMRSSYSCVHGDTLPPAPRSPLTTVTSDAPELSCASGVLGSGTAAGPADDDGLPSCSSTGAGWGGFSSLTDALLIDVGGRMFAHVSRLLL